MDIFPLRAEFTKFPHKWAERFMFDPCKIFTQDLDGNLVPPVDGNRIPHSTKGKNVETSSKSAILTVSSAPVKVILDSCICSFLDLLIWELFSFFFKAPLNS